MSSHKKSCDVIMLATPEIDHYAQHSSALWAAYCDRKGYNYFRYSERLIPDMHVNWSKIEMVRQHLAKSTAEIVTLVDADTYVCNPDLSINAIMKRFSSNAMVFSPDTTRNGPIELPLNKEAAVEYRTKRLPNAGFIAMHNSEFVRQFFDDWLDLARNELSHLADIHPRNQNVLWKGLFFKHRDQIGLLGGEVRRLQTEKQLAKAMREGCDVAHVRYQISPEGVAKLARKIEEAPAPNTQDCPQLSLSRRCRVDAFATDLREHIAYGPALLKWHVRKGLARVLRRPVRRAESVVVSLTSFTPRFQKLHTCIKSLLSQSMQPDSLVLYLPREMSSEVPPKLQSLVGDRFQIRFVDTNVRSLNKIYHALQDFPEKTIVTCDDDKIYPRNWLEGLVKKAESHPKCIICNRSREIVLTPENQVARYVEWPETSVTRPSPALLPMGVGGVLYPPSALHPDVTNADLFREICETSDDLWLKVMSLRMGTKCVQVTEIPDKYASIPYWNGEKLSQQNISEGGNDTNLRNLIMHFNLDMAKMLNAHSTYE
ncbi:MAG: glycosyltransferase [Cognatishimia sp.]|uniref:glycosyltransferase n=1 Tax=Cognatishimia sp. TaxID=2211648 RepID=UPI003B8C3201